MSNQAQSSKPKGEKEVVLASKHWDFICHLDFDIGNLTSRGYQ
jgi:hypothetical protein